MLDGDAALRRDGASRQDAPSTGSTGDRTPVRLTIHRDVVHGGEDEAYAQFVAAADPGEVLRTWCGLDAAVALCRDGADALRHVLDRDIAALDTLIAGQLDLILAEPALQELEAAWRGVSYLLEAAGDDTRVVVRILPISWAEIARDIEKASDFDQSELFDKIYNQEFGMPGGLPYGLLLCNHAVRHKRDARHRIDDIGVLTGLSQIAAASFAPCLFGAAPQLFDVPDLTDLAIVQDVTSIFRAPEYARWRALQARVDSRFLGVVTPRVLLRAAWSDDAARADGFRYKASPYGLGTGSWLWGNGIFAFGAVAIRAFRDWGWFADIRGTRLDVEEAGLVSGLPYPAFSTRESTAYRRPIEIEFTDHKQRALEEIGLIALSPCQHTEYIAALSTPSLCRPEVTLSAVVNANERLSSMLHYVLCASRFAHYIKVIVRDRIGAFTTSDALQAELQHWISRYATGNPDSSFETRARYPLGSGHVEVSDISGQPGAHACIIHLSPHFQIDQVVAAFRFQTEIRTARTA